MTKTSGTEHNENLLTTSGNITGEFDNSRSYKAGGPVWINVEAVGNWTLEVVDS